MSSIDCRRETRPTLFGLFLVSSPRQHNVVRLLAVFLTSAALAACAQSPTTTNKSELLSTGRHASLVTDKHAAGITSYGLASYYSEGTQTASGEQYDPNALTAAHPNLPFGTKLRVTRKLSSTLSNSEKTLPRPISAVPNLCPIFDLSQCTADTRTMLGSAAGLANKFVDCHDEVKCVTPVPSSCPRMPVSSSLLAN